MEVTDNGQGLPEQRQAVGNDGLNNMTERLQAIGGTCRITSDVHTGTTVTFAAPLPPQAI